ncbi:papain-like cysteine protease family protein [Acidovorax sp. CCYZU-2555]|uniref:papain-like cysteine protease family protein n=1 Tax=Acidovorax sp. CCYZU-2555 TaxID=2835042 RepID=UPI001BCABA15|nr:papain-like cysteine protease family protein [Acidovorax sp. CCYZU-2555]MBS7777913.1 hypothetical protein [Acidovorax sp. CCYZU-2555]
MQQTLTAIGSNQVSGESLLKPLGKTLGKILNVISLGIYGAYKQSAASDMKNDLLDLGKAIIKWDPDFPEIPVQLMLNGQKYEISDVPHGGVRLHECSGGESTEIDGVSLSSLRDMIFSELMNHPDFSDAMERRIFEDSTVHVDLKGMKQERANACGEACRNMILAYHGIDYDPATNSRAIFEGNTKDELLDQFLDNGLIARPLFAGGVKAYTCEQIQESLQKGPLLCELEGHYIVVHGVNALFGRIDVYCPLLGNRSTSLEEFNAHLDWDQESHQSPLMQFEKKNISTEESLSGFGQSKDADFSPGIIDRLGVLALTSIISIGNSWLKAPEDFSSMK